MPCDLSDGTSPWVAREQAPAAPPGVGVISVTSANMLDMTLLMLRSLRNWHPDAGLVPVRIYALEQGWRRGLAPPIEDLGAQVVLLPESNPAHRTSAGVLGRFKLDALLNEESPCVLLDADLLVLQPIDELFRITTQQGWFSCCEATPLSKYHEGDIRAVAGLSDVPAHRSFNTGVLGIDPLRHRDLIALARAWGTRINHIHLGDQGLLNLAYHKMYGAPPSANDSRYNGGWSSDARLRVTTCIAHLGGWARYQNVPDRLAMMNRVWSHWPRHTLITPITLTDAWKRSLPHPWSYLNQADLPRHRRALEHMRELSRELADHPFLVIENVDQAYVAHTDTLKKQAALWRDQAHRFEGLPIVPTFHLDRNGRARSPRAYPVRRAARELRGRLPFALHCPCAGTAARAVLAALILLPVLWIAWVAARDPDIVFLVPGFHGGWVAGAASQVDEQRLWLVGDQNTRFRRSFSRDQLVDDSPLVVRATGNIDIQLNGLRLDSLAHAGSWREPWSCELSQRLRPGDNTIEIVVHQQGAVPLLCVSEPGLLRTPGHWFATALNPGAEEYQPVVAPQSRAPQPTVVQRMPAWRWLRWGVALWLGLGVCAGLAYAWRSLRSMSPQLADSTKPGSNKELSVRLYRITVVGTLALIAALHFTNELAYPPDHGHDARAHLQYIRWVADHHTLPRAEYGWEMYQPPLYYVLGATIFQAVRDGLGQAAAIKSVQLLNDLAGTGLAVCAFLLARRLHPNDRAGHLLALALVGLIPLNLIISAQITNDTLAALLIAMALPPLAAHKGECGDRLMPLFLAGAILGLAMMTKYHAALALAAAIAALLLGHREASAMRRLRLLICLVAPALLLGGWVYLRNKMLYGQWFHGNWAAGPPGQFPGYRSVEFFTQMGQVFFHHPQRARWTGFFDAMHAGLWSDGQGMFVASWMTHAGALMWLTVTLAAWPMMAVALGGWATLRNAWRSRCMFDLFMVLLWAWTLQALVFFALIIPSIGAMTPRYGMHLLPIMAVFLVRGRRELDGWNRWARRTVDLSLLVILALSVLIYRYGQFRG